MENVAILGLWLFTHFFRVISGNGPSTGTSTRCCFPFAGFYRTDGNDTTTTKKFKTARKTLRTEVSAPFARASFRHTVSLATKATIQVPYTGIVAIYLRLLVLSPA